VRFENETTGLAVRIAAMFDLGRVDQAYEMIHATNLKQWYNAMRHCAIPMFNVAYADREGNIFYAYNGAIPIRDERFNWRSPVNGNDPATEWKGIYAFDDLPQVLNPPSAYVQNCNTSPFFTTDEGNPSRGDFPAYMFEDRDEDKRRAKMSRKILRSARDLTFDDFQSLAFDTTLYWPLTELPRFQRDMERLVSDNPPLAEKVRPYLEHLLDWDCKVAEASTAATLCEAWYIELYGEGYPAETIRKEYAASRLSRLNGLVKAARKLKQTHGDWKVPWGKVHRMQHLTKKEGVVEAAVSFNANRESVFSPGAPGPLGVIFTTYSTPTIRWIRPVRYAVVGASYLGVVEFGKDGVRAGSLVPYGQSTDKSSPHFMDQAQLMAGKKLKNAWFSLADVRANALCSYQPGGPEKSTKKK
jgi:acyl-homoserine lactone acylase PvdQ